jgi:dTDP-4-dehydrorhamnose reductase
MKKLIFGNGKVANIIKDENSVVIPKSQCDITNLENVLQTIHKEKPAVVINCAAIANLEDCQKEKLWSYNVNTTGPINLLVACENSNIKLVHISSGCLFDGNQKAVDEEELTNPQVWYTRTKTWADEFITNYGYNNYLILRPRQLISKKPHPSNMLTKFASMEKIAAIHEANSITCIEDFALMINHLLDIEAIGVYNCANEGTVTPHDIALAVKNTIHSELKVSSATYEEFLSILQNKRVNTILNIDKLKSTGFAPRLAKTALDWCLQNYGK